MEIQDREINGCVVLDLYADWFGYPKTLVLKNHVMHLLKAGKTHLVLNLSHVEAIDSFGIAVIISILKQCRTENGNLTLFGLNDSVNKLIEITRMDRVLDIWPTESQAVSHVRQAV
ncbi:MAG: STAS domain-containing protein [Candidatus Melainabacteria bacterium]|nr:STAS domain-containing protein [Candidatus Melainabacteria bacterium]